MAAIIEIVLFVVAMAGLIWLFVRKGKQIMRGVDS